jgi:hypothetical protein
MPPANQPPDWFEPLLMTAILPAPVRRALHESALQAAAVHRLRLARLRIHRRPGDVVSVLKDLAAAAGGGLPAALEWAGLRLDRPFDASAAAAWGRLAGALRLDWREALLPLRLSLLEAAGTPVPVAAVRARRSDASPEALLAALEEEADDTAQGHDQARRAHLRACEEEAHRAFLSMIA